MDLTNLFEIYKSVLPYSIPISMLLGALDGMHVYAIKSRYANNTSSAVLNIVGGTIWGGVVGYFYPVWLPYSVLVYLSDIPSGYNYGK
jgi:hypothetical protein